MPTAHKMVMEHTTSLRWWSVSDPLYIIEQLLRYNLYRRFYPDCLEEFTYDMLRNIQVDFMFPSFLLDGVYGENYITDYMVMFDELYFELEDYLETIMYPVYTSPVLDGLPKSITVKEAPDNVSVNVNLLY